MKTSLVCLRGQWNLEALFVGVHHSRLGIRHDHHVSNAGVDSTSDHFGSVVVELFGAEVAVCID